MGGDGVTDSRFGRVLRYPLVLLLIEFAAFAVVYVLAGQAGTRIEGLRNTPVQLLIVLACGAAAVWLYKVMGRRLERRTDDAFALPGAGREYALGLAAGFALFAAVVGAVAALGGFTIDGVRGLGRLWAMLAMAVATGLFEEVLFRGIMFRHVEAVAGSWVALAVTSAFFGMAHLANPDATWFAALAIAMEAGILLGAAYMVTRRLWLACGLHTAWNFTQGWVFSAPVSGGKAPEGLLVTRLHGPEWLSGGAFGLEASAVAVVLVTAAGLALLVRAVRRGNWVPVPWRRHAAGPRVHRG
ncbi:MAG: CPBP family intramembrane metalloprotease [Sphingomonadales bacterium]|nr:CPBP family intramembrane metalloprotease [Sphingomonadales bacterium]